MPQIGKLLMIPMAVKNYLPDLTGEMNSPFDKLIDSYIDNKIGIDSSFLTPALSKGLQENIRRLESDERMHLAGIGNQEVKDPLQKTRGDKIYWMDKKHDNAFEQE